MMYIKRKIGQKLDEFNNRVFDRRPETEKFPWDERISWKQDGDVTVLGC